MAKRPIIAITTNNSIRVKPDLFFWLLFGIYFEYKYDDNYKICYPHEFEYKICNSNDIGAIPVWLAELKESWEE